MGYLILQNTNLREASWFDRESETELELRKKVIDSYKAGEYQFAAIVDCADLEKAYQLTNNISHSWTKNAEIKDLAEYIEEQGGCRSTSVGDLIADEDDNYYLVADHGFKKIGRLPHPSIVALSESL